AAGSSTRARTRPGAARGAPGRPGASRGVRRSCRRRIPSVSCFGALLLTFALAGPAPALPGIQYPTPTGDVWVETASPGGGKPREGVGRGVIEAPPERVFRALTDYAHWSEFMPFLVKS